MTIAAVFLAFNFLGWAATVVVPMALICIPLLWAHINTKLNKIDNRNTSQHANASEVRTERYTALEARLDEVLKVTGDTNAAVHAVNTQLTDHLRDHLTAATAEKAAAAVVVAAAVTAAEKVAAAVVTAANDHAA